MSISGASIEDLVRGNLANQGLSREKAVEILKKKRLISQMLTARVA